MQGAIAVDETYRTVDGVNPEAARTFYQEQTDTSEEDTHQEDVDAYVQKLLDPTTGLIADRHEFYTAQEAFINKSELA